MSIIFYDGCFDPVTMPKVEWDSATAWVAQTGRDAVSTSAMSHGTSSAFKTATLASSAATGIIGFAFFPQNISTFGHASGYMIAACTAGGAVQLMVGITSLGYFEVRRGSTWAGGTTLGTSSGHYPLVIQQWRHLQLKVNLHTSTGSFELKYDTITVLSGSGIATSSVSGNVTAFSHGGYTANTFYLDDMWVCDTVDATATQGRPYDNFLGDLKVTTLLPTAAGDLTQWTPSTGANYTTVDEPTTANTTDYVASSVAGNKDLYNVTDLVSTATVVYAIKLGIYALKVDAGYGAVKTIIKENSVVTSGNALPLTNTAYTRMYGDTIYTKPSSPGTAFTVAEVNSLQIGVEVA